MNSKKQLGQFFTTNYEYILQNMYIPQNVKTIIEPFCGNEDLLNFVKDKNKYLIEKYDIDPKKSDIVKNDSLLNPISYKNKFIITNPPYLARNKNKEKTYYDLYDTNDLYKCFIKNILENECLGGIIIVPLNFISSIRKNDVELRKMFIKKYDILKINVFEEQVFKDTTYTVCCILFSIEKNIKNTTEINIFPINKKINIIFNEDNNYTIGGEVYNLNYKKDIVVHRLIKGDIHNTNLLLKCIDDSSTNKIQMKIVENNEIYYDMTDKKSARSYCSFIIEPKLNIQQQQLLCDKFNELLNLYREKYNSLFLTNYRESKDISRKRISFDLSYVLIKHILSNDFSI